MNDQWNNIRWGLCCLFQEEPIHFAVRQAVHLQKLERDHQLAQLAATILHNGNSLMQAIEYCSREGIGSFRVNSRIFPLKTHPRLGYRLEELPEYGAIAEIYRKTALFAAQKDIRLTFHPDQFTLLSSQDPGITGRSLAELAYQAEAAELIGADVLTLHGGGAYGDKEATLQRVIENIENLPPAIRSRLALENDDRIYSPADLLPICERTGIPFAYDIHHHRCLPDGVSIEETTGRALATWSREPLFHLSSPKEGWQSTKPGPHHDYIDVNDLPQCWRRLRVTVEVEAKAKELALKKLQKDLGQTR